MKNQLLLLIITISLLISGCAKRKVYHIVDYAAIGDGKTYCTEGIQKAIDEASSNGGGKVIVPAGKFLIGVLHLKSNVELHLEKDAVLLGSAKRLDYGSKDASALIDARNQKNISITGKGIIDGQGEELIKDIYVMLKAGTLEDTEWQSYNPWHQMRPEERNRPKILQIENCDSVVVKGITLKNGLCWIQDYNKCTNVIVDSIRVESNTFLNNDGIDFTDCKNVSLTNSFFNCADDGICFKSKDRESCCENISVSNCTVRSSASAVKFGTASWGGFKKITVRDIKVYDTYRSAIAVECVDGGVLEDIDVKNIKATNTGNGIFIRLGHRNKDSVVSKFSNVRIANIYVEVPADKPDKGYQMEGPIVRYPHNVFPSSVSGIPGHPVNNISLENIELVYSGGGDRGIACFSTDSLVKVPERESDYPEFSMFGELPAWGFYVRHVKGLTMKNVKITLKNPDYRPAAIFDDVTGLVLDEFSIPFCNTMPGIIFNKVPSPKMNRLKLTEPENKAIKIQ